MTWKSTVVASGLALMGTWLASYAPAARPRPAVSTAPSAAHTETASAEIQREADRLHQRLQQDAAFREPARNPFRFGAPRARAANAAPSERRPLIEPLPEVAEPTPAPRIALSGIAEDAISDQIVRTAIISTPGDVYLVKVGEMVGDVYEVTAVDATSVELVRIEDRSTLRLVLKP